jgi:predicted PurR-regulated permease PerM
MNSLLDARTIKVFTTLLVFMAAGAILYGARHAFLAILFAIFFAYLLGPAVSVLQRKTRLSRGSRAIAILEVYLIASLLIAALVFGLGPRVAQEGRTLAGALPGLFEKIGSGQIAWQIGGKRGWSYETQTRLQQFLASHRDTILHWAQGFGIEAARLAQNAVWLVIIPILAGFFLKDAGQFADAIANAADQKKQRQFIHGVLQDLDDMLAHFIRAQLILAAFSFIAHAAVLSALRFPYAVVLATVAGALEFIPVVGPLMAAVTILGIGFLSNYPHLILVGLFLLVWRLLQDYVSSPRIMGKELELEPLAAIIAVLVGAELAGFLGIYLSVPLMAALRILWRRWRRFSAASESQTVGPVRIGDQSDEKHLTF